MLSLAPSPGYLTGVVEGARELYVTLWLGMTRRRGLGLVPHGKSHAAWLSSRPPPKGSEFTHALQHAAPLYQQKASRGDARGLGTRVDACVCMCLWMGTRVCMCTGCIRQCSSPSLIVLV